MRALVVLLLAVARPAAGFEIESPVTTGCHEAITVAGARAAGFPDPAAAPRPTEDQRRAMDDLTFTLRDRDVWTMALLTGVRSNDLRDNEPIDLSRLVHIHNDPEDQPAHCMRKQEHDGPTGDAAALQACRDFILNQLADGGLLEEALDLDAVRPVSMYLAFRGRVDVKLPRFAYHLGKAIHALEDSYTHAFRDPPTDRVVHVANWIDSFAASYVVARDGYHHIGALDDCTRDDPRARDRVARATLSVTRLIAAIVDPAPGRRARIEAMLDVAFAQKLGCDSTNRYCGAQELNEETSKGCSASGGGTSIGLALLVLVLLCKKGGRPDLLRFVRTRGGRPLLLIAVLAPATAGADGNRWHFDARIGGALEHAAQATTVGVGADRGRFTAAALVEWNPWFSLDTSRAKLGAFNAYLTLSRRWYEGASFSLYSRAEAGTSTILFELVGVDKGSTGLYLGGSLLGVRVPVTPCVALTFDPSHFVMPIPQLAGFPFYYRQYRISVGIEVAL
ncbi:MAG: hypothetical protein H0T46_07420 [Deltaproteobacteria bacterium]|nr:hypothetical protein [Deltaproteobacteria bacterium]